MTGESAFSLNTGKVKRGIHPILAAKKTREQITALNHSIIKDGETREWITASEV